ncbi:uncharacterized protein FIBRA_09455 [Fibroporia radiculosa]|uniref:Uncharacterized protein n=1 Tax=Fibroporia radiculosa TaxID=599839 RepID=J7SCF2_9APHY|nr:uncharacterized protein FIBRA_09455 [Fibroporia radiculosa]CCM07121.1 predicted protein [Fibroporia radiculosa]
MASITILAALLLVSWTLIVLLILIIAFTVFFLKDSYTFKVHLEHTPTPLTTTPINKQALNWANNGTQVTSPIELIPIPFTDLLSALLGFFLSTLLSTLALTLRTTIRYLECEH